MKTSVEFRIYVGTYAKYNDGSLFGKWMDLSDYIDLDDFYKA
jgi:antirestriction protein